MPRRYTGQTSFDAALDRLLVLYEEGHRLVVSFSGGKDSGAILEMCILAASLTDRLPVEVIMRDEEIMFPGTFEYAERVAQRPEVDFHWIYANQPVVNVFNREQPYFWTFDPLLSPDEWVRQPPPFAYKIDEYNIDAMTIPARFPPDEGKNLYAVIGLRTAESRTRLMGIFSSKGYITKPNRHGVMNVRPIYDWTDGDVWKAHKDLGWDYNSSYDVMYRLGVSRAALRIAPPTMNMHGADSLSLAMKAWPQWFERVARRLPGVRAVAKFGKRAVMPQRKLNETWEQCFYRTCVEDAPEWIAERSARIAEQYLSRHRHHSAMPFPDAANCPTCQGVARCWKKLALYCYTGDPFSIKFNSMPYVEPSYFRPGDASWGGTPGFS